MFMQDFYDLIGEFSVTEEKKEELNNLVLKLLDKCGIRKLKEINVGEKKIMVYTKPLPDEQGIVTFDYSILEKKKRNICTYNMNTCELTVNDCGFCEFGVVMMLILVVKESYSSTRCYLSLDRKIEKIDGKALVIENLFGIRLRFPNRADLWGMYMFCKEYFKDDRIGINDLYELLPRDFEEINFKQYRDIYYVHKNNYLKFDYVEFSRDEIINSGNPKKDNYLYTTYQKLLNDQNLLSFIKNLVRKPFKERKALAEDNSEYGTLAELSLYVTPVTLVRVYTHIKEMDFFDLWKELLVDGVYQDFIDLDYDKDAKTESDYYINFYKIIRRDNEDEFLGIWKNKNLQLSEKMLNSINIWKETIESLVIPDDFEIENEIRRILDDLNKEWDIEYIAEEFIVEIMNHKGDIFYKKALQLLRNMMDKSIKYYPELTRKQAIQWIVKYQREVFETVEIVVLMQIIANREIRKEIFGF